MLLINEDDLNVSCSSRCSGSVKIHVGRFGLTAVIDGVGDDRFQRSGESAVTVLQVGGEL